MRDDFAVFILSHGRAKEQITLNSLLNASYTGKWYIIVDDLDEQKDEYIEKYGEHIIVFDKKEEYKKTDTMTAKEELKSVIYARNKSYDIAEELGLKYFGQFDDDLSSFCIRYEKGGKLKAKKIEDMDSVFSMLIDFEEASGAYSVGIDSANGMIGGLNGKFKKRIYRGLYQSIILRTDKRITFKGILNEDDIAANLYNMVGKMTFQVMEFNQSSPMRSTNEGGLQKLYDENSEYIRAFYSVMASPSNPKIMQRNGKITLRKNKETLCPYIIKERYKKHA